MGKVMVVANAAILAGSLLRSGNARAVGPQCDGVRLRSSSELGADWQDALRELVGQLPPPASACARITLSLDPTSAGGARLTGMTADGRYAERTVSRPSSLAATALGLVASIPDEAPAAPLRSGAGAIAPSPATDPVPTPTSDSASARVASLSVPRLLQVWLEVEAGVRLSEPSGTPLLDFQGRVDLIARNWIVSAALRYAPALGLDLSDSFYEETAIDLGVGRRFPFGRSALDLTVLPALLLVDAQWDEDEATPKAGTLAMFRLGANVRYSFSVGASWKLVVLADVDFAPAAVQHELTFGPGAPPIPVWTTGLRVGIAGEVL